MSLNNLPNKTSLTGSERLLYLFGQFILHSQLLFQTLSNSLQSPSSSPLPSFTKDDIISYFERNKSYHMSTSTSSQHQIYHSTSVCIQSSFRADPLLCFVSYLSYLHRNIIPSTTIFLFYKYNFILLTESFLLTFIYSQSI